ncbi:hypothetical protein GCM10007981_04300 [Thermocladium modestius]|uniref:Uncharacterized protein n=1 Tax=Thermocladium modestius TaxID=62609 RepID=A0A830GSM4_9CREN|nr:hypothetical protein GCM10007981_04300 [Thermocladium modestius]
MFVRFKDEIELLDELFDKMVRSTLQFPDGNKLSFEARFNKDSHLGCVIYMPRRMRPKIELYRVLGRLLK